MYRHAYANYPANATGDNICMGDSIRLVAQVAFGAGGYTHAWEWVYQGETVGNEGILCPNAARTYAKPLWTRGLLLLCNDNRP